MTLAEQNLFRFLGHRRGGIDALEEIVQFSARTVIMDVNLLDLDQRECFGDGVYAGHFRLVQANRYCTPLRVI